MSIHEISAWSGKPEDERPICGADEHTDPRFWDNRTVFTDYVTCADCLAMREKWNELHDKQDGEAHS